MPDTAHTIAQLCQHRRDELIQDWQSRLVAADDPTTQDLRLEMAQLLDALQAYLADSGSERQDSRQAVLDAVLARSSQDRALRGQSPESSVRFVQALKDAVLHLTARHGPGDAAERETWALMLQGVMDRCVVAQVTHFTTAREQIIRAQAQSLLELSTPVILLWDTILLLPLVGVIDSVRAVQISERLLTSIGDTEAEATLIDVTGVPVMDTSVARHLLRAVSAAEMLGTRVILTGISPATAQTMVKLGVDMGNVPTRGSLKAGLALALQLTGMTITRRTGG